MFYWIKKNSLYLSFLILISIYVFFETKDIFYQQDEWRALGEFFTLDGISQIFDRFTFAKIIFADGRMFASLIGYILVAKFPFNTFPLFLYSLGFHIINSILVFILAQKILKNNFLSFLAAVFFVVSSISNGAVTWYATSIGTLPAVSLIILSILCLLKAIQTQSSKYFLITFLLLYGSLYFKEVGYFFLIGFPIMSYLYRKITVKHFFQTFWYYLLTFGVIAVFRYFQLASYNAQTAIFTSQTSGNFPYIILTRAILYPLTSLSLIYVPSEFFIFMAKKFARIYYPFFPGPQFDLLVQSVVGDLLAISGSLLILFILYVFIKTKNLRTKTLFLLLFTLITYLPYIILSKDYTYLDSRYYYPAAVSSGILVSIFLLELSRRSKKIYYFCLFFFVCYLFTNAYISRIQIQKLADISGERRNILEQLSVLVPSLESKNIFYIIGDKNYYLREGNNLPFQQGTGYTLLTWYGRDDDRFNDFLKDGLLWDLGSQGYFEEEGRGFGYFWDEKELLKTIREQNIPESSVKAFYYNSVNKRLNEITLSP